MKRKFLALTMAGAMSIAILSGCGANSADTAGSTVDENNDDKTSDATSDEGTRADAEQSAAVEKSIKPQILLGQVSSYDMDDNTYEMLSSLFYYQVSMSEESADKYPRLAMALNTLSDDIEKDYTDRYKSLQSDAKEMYSSSPDYFGKFFYKITGAVSRADDKVVSIVENYSDYTGGAHGYYSTSGHTFNAQTGEEYRLEDIVTDMSAFTALIDDKIKEYYPELELFTTIEEYMDGYKESDLDLCWNVTNLGVTVYFNPYELASYADGMQVVSIPFAGNEGLFIEDIQDGADEYVIPVSRYSDLFIDIDGDGKNEDIYIGAEYDEYDMDMIVKNVIRVNDTELKDDTEAYDSKIYLVKNSADRYFLYVEDRGMNDWTVIKCYELANGNIQKKDTVDGWLGKSILIDDGSEYGTYYEETFTNPARFTFNQRTDILGTSSIYTVCHIDADGNIVHDDEAYYYHYENEIYANEDVSGTVVNAETGEETEFVIPSGEAVTVYRTDGSSWGEVKMSDGTVVRLKVASEYPYEINGKAQDELFNGIMYAG